MSIFHKEGFKMKKMLTFILFFIVLVGAFGSEKSNLKRYVLSDAIIQKEPAPARDTFYKGERAVFFTEFKDLGMDEEVIYHNWCFIDENGTEKVIASVPLKIKGYRWRTWSSKGLFMKGNWKVELKNRNGDTLTQKTFTVK